jgi:hypothetical protein
VSEQANVDEMPTPVEGQICSLRFISVLRQANLPAADWEETTRDLEYMFDVYLTAQPAPRNSEFTAELESLNSLAGQLTQAMSGLSGRAREALGHKIVKLTKPLFWLYVRTTQALDRVPSDMGGTEMQLRERNLMFQVAILWRRNFPTGKALTRTSAGDYRGPLLDFVENVFKLEGVRFQSSNAIGKHLYAMRIATKGKVGAPCSLIDEKARRANLRE